MFLRHDTFNKIDITVALDSLMRKNYVQVFGRMCLVLCATIIQCNNFVLLLNCFQILYMIYVQIF